jgi:hypothetical protein
MSFGSIWRKRLRGDFGSGADPLSMTDTSYPARSMALIVATCLAIEFLDRVDIAHVLGRIIRLGEQ